MLVETPSGLSPPQVTEAPAAGAEASERVGQAGQGPSASPVLPEGRGESRRAGPARVPARSDETAAPPRRPHSCQREGSPLRDDRAPLPSLLPGDSAARVNVSGSFGSVGPVSVEKGHGRVRPHARRTLRAFPHAGGKGVRDRNARRRRVRVFSRTPARLHRSPYEDRGSESDSDLGLPSSLPALSRSGARARDTGGLSHAPQCSCGAPSAMDR